MQQSYAPRERLLAEGEHHYLSLIYRYRDGQIDAASFRQHLRGRWAEQRETFWAAALWCACRDFRPLTRLLDRLDAACAETGEPDQLRRQVITWRDEHTAAKRGDPNSALAAPPRLNVFERPSPEGWVYPCTVEDIQQQLRLVPEYDLEGLWAVGLVPATRKDCDRYGTYYSRKWTTRRPVIVLWSQPACLSFGMRGRYSARELDRLVPVEIAYGLDFQAWGSRAVCRWEQPCLRRYMAEHVLLHEIGHHVQCRQRGRAGLSDFPGYRASEQFAEDYARRTVRERTTPGA